MSIIHVEDNLADAYLFKRNLLDCDDTEFNVTTVARLDEADRTLHQQSFDAAVLDLNLSDSQGIQTLKNFKRIAANIPVVVLTGTDDENTISELIRLGAQDYLHKDEVDSRVIPRIIRYAIDRKHAEAQLERMAQYDALTGLCNRSVLMSRLQSCLESPSGAEDFTALLLIDLDNFKEINDTLGHPAGDKLLIEVAERLEKCVRRTDTVARLGGDEFAVLLERTGSIDNVHEVCKKNYRYIAVQP